MTNLDKEMKCMNSKLKNDLIDFIYSFEILFDIDWEYTVDNFAGWLFFPYYENWGQNFLLKSKYAFIKKPLDEILDWCNYINFLKSYFTITGTVRQIVNEGAMTMCEKVTIDFVKCVEYVFDINWINTKVVLGYDLSGEKDITSLNSKRYLELKNNYLAMFGGEDSEATLLRPLCDDISPYWPDGAKLLEAYHAVKALDIPWKEH